MPDVAAFCAVSGDPGSAAWADLARLLGPGEFAGMFGCPVIPPSDWEPVFVLEGRQMIWSGDRRPDHPDAVSGTGVVELGASDVPEMLDLVARARPVPAAYPRTRHLPRRPRQRQAGGHGGRTAPASGMDGDQLGLHRTGGTSRKPVTFRGFRTP
ncbi:GNAT family N-acetyltransferase [Streptomyces cinerochromogenes]|nr:GNAT family N-acetyltransferase [Streptomyces cinerochromogenes]